MVSSCNRKFEILFSAVTSEHICFKKYQQEPDMTTSDTSNVHMHILKAFKQCRICCVESNYHF